MKLQPIKITVFYKTENDQVPMYEHHLKINWNKQGKILRLIDKEIKRIVMDFDLSSINGGVRTQ